MPTTGSSCRLAQDFGYKGICSFPSFLINVQVLFSLSSDFTLRSEYF